jgi:hypothetical protein
MRPKPKAGSAATGCFFMIVLTFSVDGGALKYKLDNGGSTFFTHSQVLVVEQ